LDRNAGTRLGSSDKDAEEVKAHPFFANIDWGKLVKKEIVPPFKPLIESDTDVSNFDPHFTNLEAKVESLKNDANQLSTSVQKEFKGFTFVLDSEYLKSPGGGGLQK
jgi:hypothetical protein